MVSGGFLGYLSEAHESRKLIIAGVVVSFLAFVVQQSSLDFHRDFSHNDLFHCIQLVALYIFYRAAKILFDKPTVGSPLVRPSEGSEN